MIYNLQVSHKETYPELTMIILSYGNIADKVIVMEPPQRINALARAPVPVTPVNVHPERIPKPKMAAPKVFTGNRAEFTNFLMQLTLIFKTDQARYSTHEAKIAYAASYLHGSAKEWFHPHVDLLTGNTPAFATWESFVENQKAAFDYPDAYQTAERKIHALKQGNRDCAAYHAEFITYATILNWDDCTKISFFRKGLDEELQ